MTTGFEKSYKEMLRDSGYEFVPNEFQELVYTKVQVQKNPPIVGLCDADINHYNFSNQIPWWAGSVVIIDNIHRQLALTIPIFILESPDIPMSLLEIRDYFDYVFEPFLQERYSDLNPSIGPHWLYLYRSENIFQQIDNNKISLMQPMLGNFITIRSKELLKLEKSVEILKDELTRNCPAPIIFAYPNTIPVGITEVVHDISDGKWYAIQYHEPGFVGITAIVDLLGILRKEKTTLLQHNHCGRKIHEVTPNVTKAKLIVESILDHGYRKEIPMESINIEVI